ncbi:unnamed protein product [Urochloa decumbens]|uniref:F-box domain-containing protein n=1 Tax=Urochloa decumbens TaxID=240449 RepID=A0ABC9FJQ5_9POAL
MWAIITCGGLASESNKNQLPTAASNLHSAQFRFPLSLSSSRFFLDTTPIPINRRPKRNRSAAVDPSSDPSCSSDRRFRELGNVFAAEQASQVGGGGGTLQPLPLDALFEILLRLAAKELCRLRAVSRPWRALLSDPHFIAAHAARHPSPLVVVGYGLSSGYPDGNILCDIMDLSGQVVKRIRATGDGIEKDLVVSARLDFVEIMRGLNWSRQLLDPATGAVTVLPEELADEHAALQLDIFEHRSVVAFGKVASTGEYKALRVFDNTSDEPSSEQLCEVFTIDGSNSDARWRAKRAPPVPVDVSLSNMAVVNGIAYFLLNEGYWYGYVRPKFIASFNLGTEEWRRTIQGPKFKFEGSGLGLPSSHMDFNRVSLASLNDCLAVVHCVGSAYIDIWVLMDFEKGLWVRRHRIQIKQNALDDGVFVHPLLVLNDGRIVTYIGNRGILRIYNPRTTDYTDLAVTMPYVAMDLYTGNLLSLPNAAG